jgi:bifunctional DNA-binding transcriptional regulator/antitoxin component of YhaV-PrlF toxin-antitoxin module
VGVFKATSTRDCSLSSLVNGPAPLSGVVLVTVNPVPMLVPSLALPPRSDLPRSTSTHRRRPLPLARLVAARVRSTVYGLTAVDARGRVADQTVVRALGWQPGDRLTIQVTTDVITVVADPGGPLAVSGQGRVHLPAAARHACAIRAGDRVLLAAEPADGVLVVHPLASLDAMLSHHRDHTIDGDGA